MHTAENRSGKSFVIDSDTAQGQRVQEQIIALAKELGYGEHDVFAIHLSVEEALVNAIKHGNGSDPSKKVHIDFSGDDDEFWIRIADEGPGFDPQSVPDPTAPENLERPCGRGLMLMRYYMTEVNFLDRGNAVEMRKRRGSSDNGEVKRDSE
jgi:serine/threonine-protein kinase RsbW